MYCSSSEGVAEVYFEAAREFGAVLAKRGWSLIYGGGKVGLMGALARAVHQNGGRVVGVIPAVLRDRELAYTSADELIITADLRERKAAMEARADAFVALPGGFGTLEEIIEMLTLKQLRFHAKPVVFVNTHEFFGPLVLLFDQFYRQHFAKPECMALYHVASDAAEAVQYIDTYTPAEIPPTRFKERSTPTPPPIPRS